MAEETGRVDRKEGAMGRGGFLHVWRWGAGGDREGGQEGGGNGDGGFHRWNAWADILFASNAGSPS